MTTRFRSRARRVARWMVFGVLFLAAAWTLWNWRAGVAVQEVGAEMEARGLGIRLNELHDAIPHFGAAPAVEENAAPVFRAAIALVDSVPKPDEDGSQDGVSSVMREALPQYEDALALAYRAAERPRCRFDLSWTEAFAVRLDHLLGLRNLARILRARALVRSGAGDWEGAVEDTRVLFAVSRALDEEPILISQIVRMTLVGLGFNTLRTVLPNCPRPLEALDAVKATDARGAFAFALEGESILTLDVAVSQGVGAVAGTVGSPLMASLPLRPYLRGEMAYILRSYLKFIDAAREPLPEALRRCAQLTVEVTQAAGVVSSVFLPQMGDVFRKEAELSARLAFLRLGARCLDHQARNGALPERLEDLGEFAENPFPDGPYVFRKDGDVLVVWRQEEELLRWDLGA